MEAPQFLLASDVANGGGDIASDVEYNDECYADSTFFENVSNRMQFIEQSSGSTVKRGRGRPRKRRLLTPSSILDIVDHDASPEPPVIVSISSLHQGQSRAPSKSSQISDLKQNPERPQKN